MESRTRLSATTYPALPPLPRAGSGVSCHPNSPPAAPVVGLQPHLEPILRRSN